MGRKESNQIKNFTDAFVRENVTRLYVTLWQRNDVRKFDADAISF